MLETKYPDVRVRLVGEDGNAFAIMGRTTRAMRRAGIGKEKRDEYIAEATSSDYSNLLATTMRWVNTDDDGDDDE